MGIRAHTLQFGVCAMKKSYWILTLVNYFSMGIMVPVLSLALLDRGITLTSLALIFGIYSFTVIVLEVPSGFLADLAGRKMVFILSNVFYFGAACLLLFSDSLSLLIPVIIFWGAGKAFASGSLDALMIDTYTQIKGTDSIPVVTSRLALLETLGIAAGAFLGGFVPGIAKTVFTAFGTYDLNILLRVVMLAITLLMSVMFLRETTLRTKQAIHIKRHIVESFLFVKRNHTVLLLAIGMFCGGLFIFTVETYWQPSYTALLPAPDWTLGLLSLGCFLFASAGNISIKRLFHKRQKYLYIGYIASRLALFAMLIIFSFQQSAAGFGIIFCLVYFMFGSANMAETTMLNIEIPSEKRASLLSISSFVFQAGGLAAPLSALIATSQSGIRSVWLMAGIAFFIISAVIGIFLIKIKRKEFQYAAQCSDSEANISEETIITDSADP